MALSLEKITSSNFLAVLGLHVKPKQRRFIPTVSYSLIQSMFHRPTWKRAIYKDGAPIGFVMLDLSKAKAGEIFLWRFMIDKNHQKDGNGAKAFKLLMDHIKKTWPKVDKLTSCFIPGRGGPHMFWVKRGFTVLPPTEDDRKEGVIPLEMAIVRRKRRKRSAKVIQLRAAG